MAENTGDEAFSNAFKIIKETSTENKKGDMESFERLNNISDGLNRLLDRFKEESAWGKSIEKDFKEEVIENLEATQITVASISDNQNLSSEIKEKQIEVIVQNFNDEYNKSEYYSFDNSDLVTRYFADIDNSINN